MNLRGLLDKVKRAFLTPSLKANLRTEVRSQVAIAVDRYAPSPSKIAECLTDWLYRRLGSNVIAGIVVSKLQLKIEEIFAQWADRDARIDQLCLYINGRLGL